MKYNVTFACGCTHEIVLFGPYEERYRKIEYMQECECQECERKKQLAQAQKKAEELFLPKLTGTPKQIAWAEQIRYDFVTKRWPAFLDDERSIAEKGETPDFTEEELNTAEAQIFCHTESRFWIDYRSNLCCDIDTLVSIMLKEAKREAKAKSISARVAAQARERQAEEEVLTQPS